MRPTIGLIAAMLLVAAPAVAQRGGERRKDPPRAEPERKAQPEHGRGPAAVPTPKRAPAHINGVIWMGREHPRNDPRFRLARPWEFGRFRGRLGVEHVWVLRGGTRARFSVGAGYFRVAAWEYPLVNDWWWDRDEIMIFEDPDAEGWYVAFNTRLGTSVHVLFLG